jgi:molecular chaperone DnaK
MGKEDIEKAVREAEQFAQEDKQRREEIDLRNEADQMVYQSEKLLNESGDKFGDAEKTEITAAVEALRNALAGEDVNLIKSRKEELQSKFYALSEKLYQQAGGPEGGAPGGEGFGGFPGGEAAPEDDIPQA